MSRRTSQEVRELKFARDNLAFSVPRRTSQEVRELKLDADSSFGVGDVAPRKRCVS